VHEPLWFTLLGPIRAWRGLDEVDLGSPQQRAALAALLLREGAQASVDELVDAVWDDAAPRSAEKAIRTYVYRLRRVLEPEGSVPQSVIATVGNGYVLRVGPEECDLAAFRQNLSRAEDARRAGDLAGAAAHLRAALALWRGTPLAGIQGRYADLQRTALENLRRSTIEARLTLDFQLGEFSQAVVELTALVAENPLDERFRELLMLALYRCGRQAEALSTYRQGQTVLADQLGIDPGPALRTMYERILRADPDLIETDPDSAQAPHEPPAAELIRAAPAPVPAQLPADQASFTGRDTDLERLDALLPADDAAPTVVTVVAGMAGVGKTTLAVHWAHRVAHRYPDGQLYVNLRGFEPTGSAMTPTEAMRAVLDSLGAQPQAIPADLHAQTVLYRSMLAGRRVLLLLDNARDADQVRPLLPGTPGCLVIVTSRTQLSSLVAADGARPVRLDVLPAADARLFLSHRLGAQRLADEPDATRRILDHCAGLPLALAIVAARAVIHPTFSLASIAEELRDSHGSLDAFAVCDITVDVRDVFSWSYHALAPAAARLFRLLALHPGPDVAVPAAAAVAGLPVREARQLLATLTRSHLLTEHVPGRFTSHDLLRAYATELTGTHDTADERRDAERRMFDHYLHTAHLAAGLISPNREMITLDDAAAGVVVEDIADDEQAAAWFAKEHAVLLAVIREASAQRFDTHAWQLAWAVAHFLDRRGHWQDLLTAQRIGLEAAERAGDVYGQAISHRSMARAAGDLGLFDDALVHLRRTSGLFEELDDPIAQGDTHRQFSWIYEQRGDFRAALGHAQRSLELYRAHHHRYGQASALNAVGWYHALLGQYDQALTNCSQALAVQLEIEDDYTQADTWDSLGYIYHHVGRYQEAAEAYQRAVDLYSRVGVSYATADSLKGLGETYRDAGDVTAARAAWTRALALFEELHHASADVVRDELTAIDAEPHPSAATRDTA
jgi:DNA-binding SARP family transcriptional activator